MKMESHIAERRGTPAWDKTQATVVDVMKKTLGIMVRHLQPYWDYHLWMIQRRNGLLPEPYYRYCFVIDCPRNAFELSTLGVWGSLPRNWLLRWNNPEDSGTIQFQTNYSQNFHFQGILETNMKEIRLAASDAVGVYAMAAMMEHSCMPNIKMTFDKQFNVSSVKIITTLSEFYEIIFYEKQRNQT